MKRAALAVLPLVLLSAGCAGRESVRRLDAELRSVKSEVETLRKSQEAAANDAKQTAAELRAIDARLIELRAGVGEATDEVQRLRGRVDGTEAALRAVRTDVDTLPARLAPPPPPPRPAPPKDVAQAREGSAEEAFAKALATFRAREHGQAVLEFLDFIARYPSHPLAGQAQYWIAEAYYVQRDWRQAVVEYQKVLEQASGTPKAPDALLKIGLSYTQLHDGDRAREAWRRLVRDYPGTDAAVRARPLLGARTPAPGPRSQ